MPGTCRHPAATEGSRNLSQMITYHNLSKLIITCPLFKLEYVLCFSVLLFSFFYIFFSFSFLFFSSLFFLFCFFHFSLFLFFSLSLFLIFFLFLFLQATVNKWDEVLFRHDSRRSCFNERGATNSMADRHLEACLAPPELVDTEVGVEQRTAICQSMCSEPLSSTSATTRMFTVLLSGASASKTCLAVDGGDVGPVNKVTLIFSDEIFTRCAIIEKCGFLPWLGLAWRSVSVSKSCKIDLFYEHLRQFQYSILLDIGECERSCPFLLGVVPSFSRVGPSFWGLVLPSRVGPSFWGLGLPSRDLALHSQGWPFLLRGWPFSLRRWPFLLWGRPFVLRGLALP